MGVHIQREARRALRRRVVGVKGSWGVAQNGDAQMVTFEKTRVNLWHIGALFAATAMNAFALGVVWSNLTNSVEQSKIEMNAQYAKLTERMDGGDEYRSKRSAQTDANFAALNARLMPFDTMAFRLGQNETRDSEQDKRIDRIVESFGARFDTLTDGMNALRTDVRLIGQKLDSGMRANPTVFQR